MEIPFTVTARKDTGLYNAKVGIWLFLASEVMLFGGLFSGYVFLRVYADYPWPERALPVVPGLINTFILIGSSVTVVFAWAALKMRKWLQYQIFMVITLLCALTFMVLKGIEYKAKWDHQAVRMNDFVVLEGHTHKVKLAADGSIIHEKKEGYASAPNSGESGMHLIASREGGHSSADAIGEGFRSNMVVFTGERLTVDLERFHEPIIEDLIEQAESQNSKIKLISPYVGRSSYEEEEQILAKAGDVLSIEQLKELRGMHLEAKASNAKIKTKQLRDAWARKRKEDGNKDEPSYVLKDEIEPNPAFDEFIVDLSSTVAYEIVPPAHFVFKPAKVRESEESAILAGNTSLKGEFKEKASQIEMAADAIDFRFVAQRALEKNIDPNVAIENTWIIQNNDEVAALWSKHTEHIAKLEARLLKEYGRDEQGNAKRVPTDTERYRITWQELVNMGEGNQEKGVFSGFAGADHKKEYAKHFPEVYLPRDQVNLESAFTPKWNTYYAIYFLITGLHGLHVIGGVLVLGHFLFFGKKIYRKNPEHLANRVEVGGLFWHFVDLVWIFLFPILYLM